MVCSGRRLHVHRELAFLTALQSHSLSLFLPVCFLFACFVEMGSLSVAQASLGFACGPPSIAGTTDVSQHAQL